MAELLYGGSGPPLSAAEFTEWKALYAVEAMEQQRADDKARTEAEKQRQRDQRGRSRSARRRGR